MCCVACGRSGAGASQTGRNIGTDPHSNKVVPPLCGLVQEDAISAISTWSLTPATRGNVIQPQFISLMLADVFDFSYRAVTQSPSYTSEWRRCRLLVCNLA